DAAVDLDRRPFDAEGPAKSVAEPSDEGARSVVTAGPDGEDDELVPSHSRHRVGLPDDRLQTTGERLQDRIPGTVTAHVVDVLEPVEVDDDERERLAGAARTSEGLLETVIEECTIRQARQRIAQSLRVCVSEAPIEDHTRSGGNVGAHNENRDHVVRG